MPKVRIPTLTCLRCGHEWHPRKEEVIYCPNCRSPYWRRPKNGKLEQKA